MVQERRPAPGGEDPRDVRVHPLVRLFLAGAALVLFFHFFAAFKLILLSFLAAGCLAAALKPLLRYVPGPRWFPPMLVGLIPVVVASGIIGLLVGLLAGPIRTQLEDLPQYRDQANETLIAWSRKIGIEQGLTLEQLVDNIRDFVLGRGGEVVTTTANVASGVFLVVMLILFGSIYLLSDRKGRLLSGLLHALPPRDRPGLQSALTELEPRLRWWLFGTAVSMSVVGILSWAGYSLAGLRLAAPLALVAALAELVPTIGPVISFLVALLFASTQGTPQVVGVAAVYVVVQAVESYMLLPLIMKEAVDMPPIVTLFSVVWWGLVFGAPGLLLAVPINLVIWSLLQHLVIRPRGQMGEEG